MIEGVKIETEPTGEDKSLEEDMTKEVQKEDALKIEKEVKAIVKDDETTV